MDTKNDMSEKRLQLKTLFVFIISAIVAILIAALCIAGPLCLCFARSSGWPLLLYSIPLGAFAGIYFYIEYRNDNLW